MAGTLADALRSAFSGGRSNEPYDPSTQLSRQLRRFFDSGHEYVATYEHVSWEKVYEHLKILAPDPDKEPTPEEKNAPYPDKWNGPTRASFNSNLKKFLLACPIFNRDERGMELLARQLYNFSQENDGISIDPISDEDWEIVVNLSDTYQGTVADQGIPDWGKDHELYLHDIWMLVQWHLYVNQKPLRTITPLRHLRPYEPPVNAAASESAGGLAPESVIPSVEEREKTPLESASRQPTPPSHEPTPEPTSSREPTAAPPDGVFRVLPLLSSFNTDGTIFSSSRWKQIQGSCPVLDIDFTDVLFFTEYTLRHRTNDEKAKGFDDLILPKVERVLDKGELLDLFLVAFHDDKELKNVYDTYRVANPQNTFTTGAKHVITIDDPDVPGHPKVKGIIRYVIGGKHLDVELPKLHKDGKIYKNRRFTLVPRSEFKDEADDFELSADGKDRKLTSQQNKSLTGYNRTHLRIDHWTGYPWVSLEKWPNMYAVGENTMKNPGVIGAWPKGVIQTKISNTNAVINRYRKNAGQREIYPTGFEFTPVDDVIEGIEAMTLD
jgi:hypothetical protein